MPGHPRPILQCDIHRSRAEIAAADADLNNRRELLALFIDNLAAVHLLSKIRDALLLCHIELTLVDAVCDDIAAKLASAELMQHEALLSRVDHRAVIQLLKLFGELCFRRELLQHRQCLVIHCLRRIVVCQSFRHGNAVFLHAFRAALSAHHSREVHASALLQLLKRSQSIQIFPLSHCIFLLYADTAFRIISCFSPPWEPSAMPRFSLSISDFDHLISRHDFAMNLRKTGRLREATNVVPARFRR